LLRSPPRTEGPRIVANHVHSKARSRSRAAYGFAPSAPPFGGLPRGEFPGRFRGFWLAAPLLDLRWVEHRDPRGPYDRGAPHAKACARNPPDLDADFPVASRSMRSDLLVELPLLGLSKDRPSIVPNSKSPTPGSGVSTSPFGEGQPVPPACRPRGFAPPRRIFLSDRAGLFRPAADHGVRRVSSRRETGLLTAHSCPPKLSPRR
jgi:hypothetical protein